MTSTALRPLHGGLGVMVSGSSGGYGVGMRDKGQGSRMEKDNEKSDHSIKCVAPMIRLKSTFQP